MIEHAALGGDDGLIGVREAEVDAGEVGGFEDGSLARLGAEGFHVPGFGVFDRRVVEMDVVVDDRGGDGFVLVDLDLQPIGRENERLVVGDVLGQDP